MAKYDARLRRLGFIIGAMVIWFATYSATLMALNLEPPSAAVRGGLVALGLLGFMPWLFATAMAIRAHDEFTQRKHLVALGGAFAATAVFVLASDFLQRAHFIGEVPPMRIWLVMVGCWASGLVIASRYYR